MGVPKFYRWISERYPKINQVITDSALLPEFDHLYLDMNGIIHGCTHPSHMDISDVLSEKDMMLGIMHYLDRIITQIVKPKVSVFMAIDGVAPRAKLNQQRSRRFRSAKDMAEATKDKHPFAVDVDGNQSNGPSNSKGVFDSNCITPGTEFMARVSNAIKYFIRKKIKEDPLWRDLKIIFSGHEVPGEGEHKIMEHIRDMRSQPGYQPNTRHCMYGQDADLIMLGLVSHEPHFTLLREIVDFGNGFGRNDNALKAVTKFTKQSDFQLLHLSILREYIAIEFGYGLDPKSYNLELVIDDWIFLTFLVGNDFLPHMPSLDIGDGAFDLLFNTYKNQRPTWGEGEYLTNCGEISDPARLEAFLEVIGAAENEIFEKREENEADYLKKKRRWDKRDGKPEGPSDEELAATEKLKQNDFVSMMESMIIEHGTNAKFVDGWEPPTDPGKKDFKGRYYYEKLNFTPLDIDKHNSLRKSYIEGLMWCLAYYYRGCISWGWFYPYHYGPMLSDLIDLPNIFEQIEFQIGAPLKPFEQLMGCLPPASASLVPRSYRNLMCTSDSPIIHFYPENFEVDMNGKKNPWEGVNILPFIDVALLKETIFKMCPNNLLTADEKSRNSPGKVYCYTFDAAAQDTVPSCNRDIGLPDITKCNSRVEVLAQSESNLISFKPSLIPGTTIPYPGFPSLNVLPIQTAELLPIGLNCFGSPSKYPTTLLTLHQLPQLPGATQLADSILGKSLFINWPMMHEGKVTAISDGKCIVRMVKREKKIHSYNSMEAERWQQESSVMAEQYLNGSGVPGSGGVQIGSVQIRLKLLPLQGMKSSPINGSKKKVYGKEEADVPLQMVLWKSPAPDPRFEERGPMTLKDRFPARSNVILTKGKFRGCLGTVLSLVGNDKIGLRVKVIPPEPPFGLAIARTVQESYISSVDAARVLKVLPSIFGKISGSLFFNPGRYDLGLNLKYQKKFCVLGYSRRRVISDKKSEKNTGKKNAWAASDSLLVVGNKRSDDEDDIEKVTWEYSPKAVRLVAAYRQKFPSLFVAISKYPNERSYDAKILGAEGVQMLSKIREWLNNIETAKIPRSPCTTEAMPIAAVGAVQRAADVRVAAQDKNIQKEVNIKVLPAALYREGSTTATDVLLGSENNSNDAPQLGDRIANLCANGVPFGARGTVVGIHDPSTGCVEIVFDEEFIGGSTLQGTCANFRGKLCVWNHLLKISAVDSMGIVDEMIPTGSGKATIDKMISKHDTKAPKPEDGDIPEKINSARKESEAKSNNLKPLKSSDSVRATTPSRVIDTFSSGIVSSGGKKGAWREAVGPDGSSIGFKGAGRGGKSGLQAWRRMLLSNGPTGLNIPSARPKKNRHEKSPSYEGPKTMLKLNENVHNATRSVNEKKEAVENKSLDASAGLKALLGVASNATESTTTKTTSPPPSTLKTATAADALFEIMAQTAQAPRPAEIPMPQHTQPTFNFTYVSEGEEPSSSAQHVPQMTPNMQFAGVGMPMAGLHPGMMMPGIMNMHMTGNGIPSHNPVSVSVPVKREKKVPDSSISSLLVPSITVKTKR